MSQKRTPPSAGSTACGTRYLHGIALADPHRWLEADPDRDADVRRWLEVQDQATSDFLQHCGTLGRAREFLERNHVTPDPVWHAQRGGRRFALQRRAGLPQPLLYAREPDGAERVLLDPNAVGSVLQPDQVSVSPSGRYLTVMLCRPGEVLGAIHVLDAVSGEVIETGDFGTVMSAVAWHPREEGFYYSLCRRLFEEHQRRDGLYWHALGTAWTDDACVKPYHDGPGHIVCGTVVAEEWLLMQTLHFSSRNGGFSLRRLDSTAPASGRGSDDVVLFEDGEGYSSFLGAAGGLLYFHTCVDAPNGRVVAVDPARPAEWRTVVAEDVLALARPERFGGPPKSALSTAGLLLAYVEHAHDTLRHVTLDGAPVRRIDPPTYSTVDAVFPTPQGFRVCTQSFLEPRCVYDYVVSSGTVLEVERTAMPDVAPGDCELTQVFYPAGDGTQVPMYLLHRRGLRPDGPVPTLLYAYGGFGQSINPEYSPEIALWLSLGGIYALANIRGGGEYGERWHAAGSRLAKQTSFDDFYAAADYLVARGYSSAAHLVARGISNGGLLTAVCVNQRPDLFAAVVSEVPLVDVLWLHETSLGQAVTAEYGNPAADRATFDVMRSYSPLQNVRSDGRAPAQLVVVADRDTSAPPPQAYKYVAARQEARRSAGEYAPVLLRIVHGEGHNDWKTQSSRRTLAEEIAFLHHFALAGDAARLRQMRDLKVPMRDGVLLSTNVWCPGSGSSFPVVLLRTPYRNDEREFERLGLRAYVEAGYAVALQSVRGRGGSQGTFGFFFVEGKDGYDAVEWIAAQPWCNGKVGMDGGSYLATAQWQAARERPPHLACILPAAPAANFFNELPYLGGALQVDWAFSWLGAMAGIDFDFDTSGDRNLERFRPLIDAGRVLGAELPLYRQILDHSTLDEWWRGLYLGAEDFARIDIPVFTVTGWFDGDQPGAMYCWHGLEEHAPTRADRQLVVGPWEHAHCYLGGESRVGELEFGTDSLLPLQRMRLAFLDEHLQGIPRPPAPRVQLYLTGSNRWQAFDRYPPPGVQHRRWFLASAGDANTERGGGRLDEASMHGPPDTFVFDPTDPVPYKPGAQDHREIEQRSDVLVYTSAVLQEPLTVIGLVEVVLHAASDAPDTDFTAKLLDVDEAGRAISLTHMGGVLRARYRHGFDRPQLLTPGKPERFQIRLSHVGHTFRAGHRIRLEVSSSCFPMIDPNPNTGREIATETECRRAHQTILHDAQHPSHLLLPVWNPSSPGTRER
jgi:putative CocE/NonD family hydrolase